MAIFEYQADVNGKIVKGQLNAKSIAVAKLKLKSRNIDPIYVQKKAAVAYFSGGGKIKQLDLLLVTRQMHFLLSSGLSLIQSLNMVIKLVDNQYLKIVLLNITKQVEGGSSFSGALSKYPKVFDGFYVNMMMAAEKTGMLDKNLGELVVYIEKSQEIKAKVKSAMTYPILVLCISFFIIVGIILFVVPKFESIYGSMGGELPFITQMFVNLNHLMLEKWYILVGLVFGGPFALWQFYKTESGRKTITGVIDLIPMFSKLQYSGAIARYCRAFSSLLKSGITFLEALDISSNIAAHDKVSGGLKFARKYVSQGRSFKQGLEKSKAFPILVVNMTAIGEESGQLHQNYEKLTEFYENEVDNKVTALIKMIEPLLIVFLGGTIGLIILALYLPVFNLGSVVN